MEEGCLRNGWYDTKPRGELVRYALSAMAVAVVAAAGATVLTRAPVAPATSEMADAVLVDLPPALASSGPRSEAPDGPEQAASEATPAAPPAPPPPSVTPPAETPPEVPHPDAVVEKENVSPPPPPPAAAAPAVEEQAPSGADAKTAIAEDEAPSPSPDAHALAAWQRAMVERLETAKGSSGKHAHMVGTVIVAFRIDRRGRLVEEHVDGMSAGAGLDAAALGLLAAAAPFPAPPAGVGDAGLTFTVPIRFNPRR